MMSLTHVPDLDSLQLLIRVASTGSLGLAAAEHGISQPAVSARVKSMERLVGFPLVTRSPRGSTLTTEGSLLADWARDVLHAAGVLEAGIGSLRHDRQVRLRVAASLTVAEHLVPLWLVRLAATTTRDRREPDGPQLRGRGGPGARRYGGPGLRRGPAHPGRPRLPDRRPRPARRRRPARAPVGEAPRAARAGDARRDPAGPARTDQRARAPPSRPHSRSGRRWRPRCSSWPTRAHSGRRSPPEPGPAVLSELAVADDVAAGRVVRVPCTELDLARSLRAVWPRGQRTHGIGPRPAGDRVAQGPRSADLSARSDPPPGRQARCRPGPRLPRRPAGSRAR